MKCSWILSWLCSDCRAEVSGPIINAEPVSSLLKVHIVAGAADMALSPRVKHILVGGKAVKVNLHPQTASSQDFCTLCCRNLRIFHTNQMFWHD